jgi:hypothetical protein
LNGSLLFGPSGVAAQPYDGCGNQPKIMNADFVSASPPAPRKGMPDPPKTELLRSLARLVRGLSALFWGLPLMIVVYVQTARTDWLDILGWMAMLPSLMVTGLVFYGLLQMHAFQRQERVWIRALDRAQILIFINLGLCPFLYWWHKLPNIPLFLWAVAVLGFCSIFFLFNLNHVLERLTAMLPDEALREETHLFTTFNRSLVASIPVIIVAYFLLLQFKTLPRPLIALLAAIEPFGHWLILFLILMPLAMTMALIWKIKEVIFTSVFESER